MDILLFRPGHAWQCTPMRRQRPDPRHVSCRKTSVQCLLSWWPAVLWTSHDAGHRRRVSPQQRTIRRGRFEDFLPRVHCGSWPVLPPGVNIESASIFWRALCCWTIFAEWNLMNWAACCIQFWKKNQTLTFLYQTISIVLSALFIVLSQAAVLQSSCLSSRHQLFPARKQSS